MFKRIIFLVIIFSFFVFAPNLAQANNEASAQGLSNEENMVDSTDESNENTSESAVKQDGITSIDGMLMGKHGERALATAAAYCVESEQYDKAIKLSRMALDRNDDDNEIHQVYAEALEGKLNAQVDKDPALFNECVKQWLVVLRQEFGDEKLTCHGLGIPGLGYLYKDEERVIPARKHLMKLVGSTPKVWETDARYLKRVTAPGSNNLYGKVISQRARTSTVSSKQSD